MQEREILCILEELGVLSRGHYVYKAGMHGDCYVNKDALYPHTRETELLCRMLAEKFADSNADVVIGPALGGIVLSQLVASYLKWRTGRNILALYAEKINNGSDVAIKRGYDKLIFDKHVLVVEDVVTTGSSIAKVIAKTREHGGIVVAAGALWNRGGIEIKNIPRFSSLVNRQLEMWDPEYLCPLCKNGIPINTDVGRGAEYLAQKESKQKRPSS